MSEILWGVAGLVVGGILAIIAGIATAYFSVRLEGRRRDKEMMREKVYGPLYDEVVQVVETEGQQIDKAFTTKWEFLGPSWKIRLTELTLRRELDAYKRELDALQNFLREGERLRGDTRGFGRTIVLSPGEDLAESEQRVGNGIKDSRAKLLALAQTLKTSLEKELDC